MNSAAMLANDNAQLRAENERQKKKTAKKRKHITRGGVLGAAEGLSLIEASRSALEEGVRTVRPSESALEEGTRAGGPIVVEPQRLAPPKCSMCSSMEHNARTCPMR